MKRPILGTLLCVSLVCAMCLLTAPPGAQAGAIWGSQGAHPNGLVWGGAET